MYAHVASDPSHPEMIALQYWFFYLFNDFNNLHEGDWEMIQLDFDASTARAALSQDPVAVGYSSHEGAERAHWGDDKLELVGGTPSRRLSGRRVAREQVHAGAVPRQLGQGRGRLRRHAKSPR